MELREYRPNPNEKSPFSPEEMEQLKAAHQEYSAIRSLYQQLIEKEYCPARKKHLALLLEELNEENK